MCIGLFTLAGIPAALQAGPEKERTISFYHIHTKETLTVTYKRDGRYLPDALKSIDWFMRDWRQNTVVKIDPRTIDILWEMHTELGSQKPINIICGYRSRKTNRMLRRKRGGQASNSLHIYGKAIDAHFPDVPVRYVRYAALVRERGGVGYYPTSALPFVHVDTGRIRHWPRMKRDELALLFSNGRSKHVPSGGRRLRPSDVKRAKARRQDLAVQVAAYHTLRAQPKTPTLIADSGLIKPPKPTLATRPAKPAPTTTVALNNRTAQPQATPRPPPNSREPTAPQPWTVEVAPNTRVALASPTPGVERSIRFEPRPSESDRALLSRLVAEATFVPLVEPPKLLHTTDVDQSERSSPAINPTPQPELVDRPAPAQPLSDRFKWAAPGIVAVLDDRAWTAAPEYDDDHPDELAYRPFPIGPLMTAQLNNPTLNRMTKPDNARTLEMLADDGTIPRMRLRPPQKLAQLMWRQEFSGRAVELYDDTRADAATTLSSRQVTTSAE